jgi:hypothetical protein
VCHWHRCEWDPGLPCRDHVLPSFTVSVLHSFGRMSSFSYLTSDLDKSHKFPPSLSLYWIQTNGSMNMHRTMGWPNLVRIQTYSPPTLTTVGHQWTESTSTGCNQWLSLAKIALKVPTACRNHSLVARTSRCGECINLSLFALGWHIPWLYSEAPCERTQTS